MAMLAKIGINISIGENIFLFWNQQKDIERNSMRIVLYDRKMDIPSVCSITRIVVKKSSII